MSAVPSNQSARTLRENDGGADLVTKAESEGDEQASKQGDDQASKP